MTELKVRGTWIGWAIAGTLTAALLAATAAALFLAAMHFLDPAGWPSPLPPPSEGAGRWVVTPLAAFGVFATAWALWRGLLAVARLASR